MAPLLASGRSDRAFERMYRKHVHDVYRYALGMLRNPDDAEDVTQTTFMNAYRAFERGERPRQAQNWLMTIAHNVCRQRFRNASRRPTETEWDDALAAPVPDDDTGPSIADVQRALEHLPFNQRSALVMRELEGRSYAEIAAVLELTVSAVETLLFRARRALREQLEGALTCGEAERSISRQLDGALPREERGRLRAHLRECKECARDARRLRAQRAALKGLGAVPLPASLISWVGGGSAAAAGGSALGAGLLAKGAAVVAAGAVVAGAGHEVVTARDKPAAAPVPAALDASSSVDRARVARVAAAPAKPLQVVVSPTRARPRNAPPAQAAPHGAPKPKKAKKTKKPKARGSSAPVVGALTGAPERPADAEADPTAPKARKAKTDPPREGGSRGTTASRTPKPKAAKRTPPDAVVVPREKPRDSKPAREAGPVGPGPKRTTDEPTPRAEENRPNNSDGKPVTAANAPAPPPVVEQVKEKVKDTAGKLGAEPPPPPKVKIP